MYRKMVFVIIALLILVGCTTERNKDLESPGYAQSVPATRSEDVVPASGSLGTVQVIGGDERTLREFIQRWFAPMYATSGDADTIVMMGGLPDNLPVYFPLPDEAQVYASIQSPTELQVLVDVPIAAEDVLVSYSETLAEAEWIPATQNSQGGGFVSSTNRWLLFCNTEAQAALSVQTFPKSSRETEIRASLYTKDAEYMCDPQSDQTTDEAYAMIPILTAPPEAFVLNAGSSSGGGTAESTSDIRTVLTPQEISDQYASQLEAQGWQPETGGDTGNLSWSSWTINDDQGDIWYGILVIINNPIDEDLLFGLMRISKDSK